MNHYSNQFRSHVPQLDYDVHKYSRPEYEANKQIQHSTQLDLHRTTQLAGLKRPTGQLFPDIDYENQYPYSEAPTRCIEGYVTHTPVHNPQFGHNYIHYQAEPLYMRDHLNKK